MTYKLDYKSVRKTQVTSKKHESEFHMIECQTAYMNICLIFLLIIK
jgi:hypothetical protein